MKMQIQFILIKNFNIYLKETIESSINKNGEKVFYMKLPLKSINQNEENLAEHNKLPKIKIEKVILCYALSESVKDLVNDFIKMNFYKKYGYQISIENSKIFND